MCGDAVSDPEIGTKVVGTMLVGLGFGFFCRHCGWMGWKQGHLKASRAGKMTEAVAVCLL